MKPFILISSLVLSLSIISCGSKKDDYEEIEAPKNAFEALSAISKAGKNMEKNMKDTQGKLEERRAKGDTLAMHYEELMKFLPDEISGYKRNEPNGGTVNMMGMSYSSAEARYENSNGNYLKITLVDYNQAYGIYQTATAMWAMGMSIDTPDEKANGVKINDDIAGWESFKKKTKDAQLVLGIGHRFWLSIEGDQQEDTKFLRKVAKEVNMDKLAAI